MRKTTTPLALAASLILAALFSLPSPARADIDPAGVGKEIKRAIMNRDFAMLGRHLKNNPYFIDESYSRKELLKLFRSENSWLNRNLFVGEDSVKAYFEKAKDLKIVTWKAGPSEYVISYQSSNFPPHEWPWCSIKPRGKSWVFADMFAYR